MKKEAKVYWDEDGTVHIDNPQAMSEEEFIFVMSNHLFGPEAADEILAAGAIDAPEDDAEIFVTRTERMVPASGCVAVSPRNRRGH